MQVDLVGPAGRAGSVQGALLDTGASYSMFGALLARQAGYNIGSLGTTTITLADGSVASVPFISNARLRIEGHLVRMARLLLRPGQGLDLLCPNDLLKATEFGCSATDVYFD